MLVIFSAQSTTPSRASYPWIMIRLPILLRPLRGENGHDVLDADLTLNSAGSIEAPFFEPFRLLFRRAPGKDLPENARVVLSRGHCI
jgi:hypothetical protein